MHQQHQVWMNNHMKRERGGHWNWCWILSLPLYLTISMAKESPLPAPCMVTRKKKKCTQQEHLQIVWCSFGQKWMCLWWRRGVKETEWDRQRGGTWLEKHWTFTCVTSQQPVKISQLLSLARAHTRSWLTHKSGFWVSRLILWKKSLTSSSEPSKESSCGCSSSVCFSISNKMQIFIYKKPKKEKRLFGMHTAGQHIQLHC